jgi:hypothetical protein
MAVTILLDDFMALAEALDAELLRRSRSLAPRAIFALKLVINNLPIIACELLTIA